MAIHGWRPGYRTISSGDIHAVKWMALISKRYMFGSPVWLPYPRVYRRGEAFRLAALGHLQSTDGVIIPGRVILNFQGEATPAIAMTFFRNPDLVFRLRPGRMLGGGGPWQSLNTREGPESHIRCESIRKRGKGEENKRYRGTGVQKRVSRMFLCGLSQFKVCCRAPRVKNHDVSRPQPSSQ